MIKFTLFIALPHSYGLKSNKYGLFFYQSLPGATQSQYLHKWYFWKHSTQRGSSWKWRRGSFLSLPHLSPHSLLLLPGRLLHWPFAVQFLLSSSSRFIEKLNLFFIRRTKSFQFMECDRQVKSIGGTCILKEKWLESSAFIVYTRLQRNVEIRCPFPRDILGRERPLRQLRAMSIVPVSLCWHSECHVIWLIRMLVESKKFIELELYMNV